jgi:hypothetical protein
MLGLLSGIACYQTYNAVDDNFVRSLEVEAASDAATVDGLRFSRALDERSPICSTRWRSLAALRAGAAVVSPMGSPVGGAIVYRGRSTW